MSRTPRSDASKCDAPSGSNGESGLNVHNTFKIKKNQAVPLLRDPIEVTRTQTARHGEAKGDWQEGEEARERP